VFTDKRRTLSASGLVGLEALSHDVRDQKKMKVKGQHHIPRFLLNGFASRQSGREYYTWVFRTGRDPVESNTRDVAKQKFFHGDPAVSPLEGAIADRETGFSSLLQRVRAGGIAPADVPLVCELVVHLAVRTKNLRDGVAQLERDVFDVAEEKLIAPDKNLRRRLRRAARKAFHDEMQKPELKTALSLLPPKQRRAAMAVAKAKVAKLNVPLEAASFFNLFRGQFAGAIDASARKTHLNILSQDMAPAKRVAELTSFAWTVVTPKGGVLVLGDVAVIGKVTGVDGFVHPITSDTDRPATAIILPIAPDAAIVGSIGPMGEIPASELNTASVELSRDFFVARDVTDVERGLIPLVARRSDLFTKDEIRHLMQK
jgi:hypothetical protein